MTAFFNLAGAGAAAAWRSLRTLPGRKAEAISALNGLVGDLLEERGHDLAIPMQLRIEGERTSKLCVMVHGLMSSDVRWIVRGRPGETFASMLAEDRGTTAVYVSYNSGRHISTNGRELAERLEHVVARWPVPVSEINFVGHSLGGLVVRSACHYAVTDGRTWAAKVRRIFLLGAPNRGATLEQLGYQINGAISTLPVGVAQALGRLVDRRSAGIKDLRRGSIVDEDWQEGTRHPVLLPPGAEVYAACASLFGGADNPVGKVLGDVMVTQYSAQGRRVGRPSVLCTDDRVATFAGGHLRLASDPQVYDQILAWWPAVDTLAAGSYAEAANEESQ